VIGEVNAWTSNVMNLIWLIGTFTFAVVLAVVTEDIVATVLVSLLPTSLLCLPLYCVTFLTLSPWDSIIALWSCLCCVIFLILSPGDGIAFLTPSPGDAVMTLWSCLCCVTLLTFEPWGCNDSTMVMSVPCHLSDSKLWGEL